MTPATKLLNWFERYGRDLPWRRTRDPYAILVSEVMLQQTQVDRVLSYYDAWLKRFPDWQVLAKASNADVLHAWAGLGYNRRALALRDIAIQVHELGEPHSEEDWLSFKGIGPYTAAALTAFAGKKRTLPIDTNIRRVLARFLLGIPFPELKDDAEIKSAAEDFLPRRGRYYDIPQALFDLATMICSKTPDCSSCPLQKECKASALFLSGTVSIPKAMIKKAKESKHRDKPHPDRIFRGRILKSVRNNPKGIDIENLGHRVDPKFNETEDMNWLIAMVKRLEKDGMVTMNKAGIVTLYED